WQIAIYGMFGFGFYLLHGCIQVHVTELSQTARGAAASLHSSFFYLGQAVGPVVYGYGFAHGGPEPSIFVGAAVGMTVGVACSRLLRPPTVYLDSPALQHGAVCRTALCNGARMPIMSFDGLGCRAYAAEITPMEPVWVIPAKGAAGCRIAPHPMSESPMWPSLAPGSSVSPSLGDWRHRGRRFRSSIGAQPAPARATPLPACWRPVPRLSRAKKPLSRSAAKAKRAGPLSPRSC